MISLTCTHCQTVLSIDDAFAGGVCRCQHCGTIQTVPSHLKNGDSANANLTAAQTVGAGPKALYQSQRKGGATSSESGTGSGTGLEDLADVVAASSGLSGSGLSTLGSHKTTRQPPRRSMDIAPGNTPVKSRRPLLIGIVVAAVAIAAVAAYLATNSSSKQPQTSATGSTDGETPAVVGPQYCGVPISGNSVVFLLDRGDSARQVFDGMKEAAFKAIESLGPDRKFQILLWDNETGDAGFPLSDLTFATKENLDSCRKALEDVTPEHQSTIHQPLVKAVAETPDSIVIVTAKGFELDDSFVTDVQSLTKPTSIKLFTISLLTESKPLETLAKQSHGTYKMLAESAFHASVGE